MSFSLKVTVAKGIKYFLLKGLGWKRVRTQPKEEATYGAHCSIHRAVFEFGTIAYITRYYILQNLTLLIKTKA